MPKALPVQGIALWCIPFGLTEKKIVEGSPALAKDLWIFREVEKDGQSCLLLGTRSGIPA
jgi:hypothetical protein